MQQNKELLTTHDKVEIGSTSGHKWKHVEWKGLDDPSSFKKTVGLSIKDVKDNSSKSKKVALSNPGGEA